MIVDWEEGLGAEQSYANQLLRPENLTTTLADNVQARFQRVIGFQKYYRHLYLIPFDSFNFQLNIIEVLLKTYL